MPRPAYVLVRRTPRLRPEATGAETKLEPAAGEQVEARGRLGEHRGRPQREVGDVGKQSDPTRTPSNQPKQCHHTRLAAALRSGGGVDVPALVWVVLDRDAVQTAGLGLDGRGQQLGVRMGTRK